MQNLKKEKKKKFQCEMGKKKSARNQIYLFI